MNKPLNIGVDARPLSSPLTGIGQYTYQLLLRLTQMGHRWFLYSNKPFIVDFPEQENIIQVIHSAPFKIPGAIWGQSVLPYLIHRDEIDVFWSPRHHLPILGNTKLPMVVTIHDLVYKLFKDTVRSGNYLLESLLLPRSAKRANIIATVSSTTKEDLITHLHIAEKKIEVIYPGLNSLAASASHEALKTLGINKSYILFVGTLEPRKNLTRLITAYANLPESLRSNYQLVLAGGSGWGNEKLPELIKSLSLQNHVIMPGFVSEEIRSLLLRNATVFAFPSLYEGFGLPILEAMAVGVPVLTSNLGGTAEVASDAAYVIDPYNITDIAQGLNQLLSNKELRDNFVQKGIMRSEKFSWDKASCALFNTLLLASSCHHEK